ncbi:MAG: hypothetical protein N2749_03105 [Clostridia bacterium]|nr:hypothetical protein [Clostridia bacterium]
MTYSDSFIELVKKTFPMDYELLGFVQTGDDASAYIKLRGYCSENIPGASEVFRQVSEMYCKGKKKTKSRR